MCVFVLFPIVNTILRIRLVIEVNKITLSERLQLCCVVSESFKQQLAETFIFQC